MGKKTLIMLIGSAAILVFGLACSAASALSYVTAQSWNPAEPAEAAAPEEISLPEAELARPEPAGLPIPEEEVVVEEEGEPAEPERLNTANAEEEYYRAVFDVCMYSAAQADIAREKALEGCQDFVRRSMNGSWYEEPSHDWEWPMPALATGPGA